MKFLMTIVVCIGTMACGGSAWADETPSAADIFKRTVEAYRLLQSYSSEGSIESRVESGGMLKISTTDFTMRMKKPDRYLIAWRQEVMPDYRGDGAVWHAGDGAPYFYMGALGAYSKMASHEMALGAATGLSGGAAFTLPSLFLDVVGPGTAPFERLRDPAVVKEEELDGHPCYVVGGASSLSREELYWIGKGDFLIRKYVRSLEPPEGGVEIPETDDEAIKDGIRQLGREVTDEAVAQMRALMENARELTTKMRMKGAFTEVHTHISSPDMPDEEFIFPLPGRAILKDSLFEEMGGLMGPPGTAAGKQEP